MIHKVFHALCNRTILKRVCPEHMQHQGEDQSIVPTDVPVEKTSPVEAMIAVRQIQDGDICFEWNKQMWLGEPRNEDPVLSACGLEECIKCPKPQFIREEQECFEWNRQLWVGQAPTDPAYTVCGLEECIKCKKRIVEPHDRCFEWNKQMWLGVPRRYDPFWTACGLEECIECPRPDFDKESQLCFEWNEHLWVGIAPTNPVYTICGLEECEPCQQDTI